MKHNQHTNAKRAIRRGAALLVCLFVFTICSLILVGILNTAASRMTALHNTTDYERALYLAGAGAHSALAELEADSGWTTGIPSTVFPSGSGNTFSATVAAGGGGTVVITGTGISGGITRKLTVTIQPGS